MLMSAKQDASKQDGCSPGRTLAPSRRRRPGNLTDREVTNEGADMQYRTWAGLAIAAVAVLAVVVLAWPDGGDPSTPDADGRLEIIMENYRFEIDEWTVVAGQPITLVLINRDEVSHPLTFGGELILEDGRPVDYTNELFAGLSPRVSPATAVIEPTATRQGFTVQVSGGQTVTIDIEFPADRVGAWGVGCFLGRGCHFNAGLEGTLNVTDE